MPGAGETRAANDSTENGFTVGNTLETDNSTQTSERIDEASMRIL